jgi:hypothetical protein
MAGWHRRRGADEEEGEKEATKLAGAMIVVLLGDAFASGIGRGALNALRGRMRKAGCHSNDKG